MHSNRLIFKGKNGLTITAIIHHKKKKTGKSKKLLAITVNGLIRHP